MTAPEAHAIVSDLFRRESGRLVAALVRLFGPARVTLAEDAVQDALVAAMHAWRFEVPADPTAWILQTAKRRAIDVLRRDRRFGEIQLELGSPDRAIDRALSPEADAKNQIALMLAIGDDALSPETHATLILRLLGGLSAPEIARAFLVDVATIDRRLSRGRARLALLGSLDAIGDLRARQPAIEQALYLLFNEGYHGSDPESPLHPAMCADALRLAETLLGEPAIERPRLHALAGLFCLHAARLATRMDESGTLVPLAEQDRSRWDRSLVERGIGHLGASAEGDAMTRFHLEAGIALEHALAPSLAETDWPRVVELYDALVRIAPGSIVALNRAVAIAELRGPDAGREALRVIGDDPKLRGYSFWWAARADVERRAGAYREAITLYGEAIACARSDAERRSYERRIATILS